jgi:hypothetical protein
MRARNMTRVTKPGGVDQAWRWIFFLSCMSAFIVVALPMIGTEAALASERDNVKLACSLCDGLAQKMGGDANQPVIMRSFEPANGGSALHPALENTGFTYDNAVVLIALAGCNRMSEARRIADALVMAVDTDRHYQDSRLRNAYRVGPVVAGSDGMLLPGYWNAVGNAWAEDGYQVGSATGSTAWGALALLVAYDRTGEQIYLDTAIRVMNWIHSATADPQRAGYFGGFFGHEPSPVSAKWKSTEHNLDVYAVDRWLSAVDPDGGWEAYSEKALKFLEEMWHDGEGRFHIGSVEDGNAPNLAASGLDAELWPLIAVPAFADRRDTVLGWTERHHGVEGGFDFNNDRDGVWLEGTAQAALVYEINDQPDKAAALLETIASNVSKDQLVYATVDEELTTGLQVGPGSSPGDFKYYRLPHIGATGWAILAALKLNPFVAPSLSKNGSSDPCHQKS